MKIFQRLPTSPTKVRRLFDILCDLEWHDTKELARRVGHTFIVAKWRLETRGKWPSDEFPHSFEIEKRRHPMDPFQWQYRLVWTDLAAA